MGHGWSGACEAAVQRPMTELLDALYTSTVILVSGTQCGSLLAFVHDAAAGLRVCLVQRKWLVVCLAVVATGC